jgi:hypothetical protein
MKLSETWVSLAVIVFKYQERPPLYYVSILRAKKREDKIDVRREKLYPPNIDIKVVITEAKTLAHRLKIPYVVGAIYKGTSIVLQVMDGKEVKDVVYK